MKKKYNLRRLMLKAWSLFRRVAKKGNASFADSLKAAWVWIRVQATNTAKVEAAAKAAGYGDIEAHSWAGWQSLGRTVKHESKALFQVTVDDPTTKSGTRVKSYFGIHQTEPLTA